jgi:hydrogenase maturation protease
VKALRTTLGAFTYYCHGRGKLRTLVIGLGNPILGDDGVGWRIAEELEQVGGLPPDVDIVCLAVGGISLMEALEGYDRAIIIDAIVTHKALPGTISTYHVEDLTDPFFNHLSSAHDTSLQNALRIGRELGIPLPEEITLVAVESQRVYDFSEELTPPVAAAVLEAVKLVHELVK